MNLAPKLKSQLLSSKLIFALAAAILMGGFFVANNALAATINSTQTGNWSAVSTWAPVNRTGTIAYNSGSAAVTGTGTSFTTELAVGSTIITTGPGITRTVASIIDNTHLTLTANSTRTQSGKSFTAQVVPFSGDNVNIDSGDTVTVDDNYNCASLAFPSDNGSSALVSINSGKILTVSGSITIPRANSGHTNTMAVGAGNLNAGSIAFTNGGNTQRHFLTISTGTVTVTGNITQSGSNGSASITFTGAGLLRLGGAFLTSSTGTFTPNTGTVEYNAVGAQTVGNFTYNNLILSGSGAKSIVTGTTVGNNLSISGTAIASIGTGLNINVNSLTLGGANKFSGTWGSTTSNAAHKDNTYFAATTGKLNVAIGPSDLSALTAEIGVAQAAVSAAVVGEAPGQYTQDSVDTLNAA
ncbi:MAG: hypothetical protein PHE24_06135, partial [Patescibacteria group bacterium]|nr:hypothetical protein [Patescibacteria group bacterium]